MILFANALIITLFCVAGWTLADYIPNSGNWYSGQNVQVSTAFTQNGIVPDVIDTAPLQQLIMAFDRNNFVSLGNEMTPAGVVTQPAVFWPVTYANQLYTLVELDLDAPSRTNSSFRSVLHWLVYNIPGNDVFRGEVYASYMGSAPFANSGFHRYVFLVLPQTGRITLPPLPSGNAGRIGFNIRNFMRQNGLNQPFAGNFYNAQADAYSIRFWVSQGGSP